MRRSVGVLVVIALVGALALTGCSQVKKATLKPKVSPPAIKTEGVLKAGVDMSYPPFAGIDNGKRAGIDVDVASALAGKLGLKVQLVDVKPSEAATALAEGRADVVLSVPLTAESLSGASIAGTYITDGPALFVATEGTKSVEPTLSLDVLGADPVGAQQDSAAWWALLSSFGTTESIKPYPSLREALEALADGDIKIAAGDALVGSYIARDVSGVAYAGQAGSASPLGVAVGPDNTALGNAVRSALDSLAADGVLDTIRRKWVGDLPKLELPADQSAETSDAP